MELKSSLLMNSVVILIARLLAITKKTIGLLGCLRLGKENSQGVQESSSSSRKPSLMPPGCMRVPPLCAKHPKGELAPAPFLLKLCPFSASWSSRPLPHNLCESPPASGCVHLVSRDKPRWRSL